MTRFNLHYGQARVMRTDEGEPVRMVHRRTPYKRAIQFADEDPDVRLNVQYDADLETGAVEVRHAINIAKMYMLGYPLQIAEIAAERDIQPEARPADEVALEHLRTLPVHTAHIYAASVGVNLGTDDRQMLVLTARRIDDPWGLFGLKPQMQRRVDLNNLPPFLVFPRPDKAFRSTLEDDPFWGYVDGLTRMSLRAHCADANPDMGNWHWSDLYRIT